MRINFLMLSFWLVVTTSCSSPEVQKKEPLTEGLQGLLDIRNSHQKEIKMCQAHLEEVIKKSYNDELDKNYANKFVKDEKEALKLIRLFDFKKLGRVEVEKESAHKLKYCHDDYSQLKLEECDTSFSTFDFMESLLYAAKNNQWSVETRKEAMMLVKSYILDFANEESTVLEFLMGLNIFSKLGEAGYFSAESSKKVKTLSDYATKKVDSYKKQQNNFMKKNYNNSDCRFWAEEFAQSKNKLLKDLYPRLQKLLPLLDKI